jgi:hypothetical protein
MMCSPRSCRNSRVEDTSWLKRWKRRKPRGVHALRGSCAAQRATCGRARRGSSGARCEPVTSRRTLRHTARSQVFLLIRQQTHEPIAYRRVSCCLERIDSRTQPMDAFNRCRRRAVTMTLDSTSQKDTSVQGEMSRTTVIATVKAKEAGDWKAVDVGHGGWPAGVGKISEQTEIRSLGRSAARPHGLVDRSRPAAVWHRAELTVSALVVRAPGQRLHRNCGGAMRACW